MKKFLFAALMSLGIAGAAQAAPTLQFRVYEDNALVGGLSTSSSSGLLAASGSTTYFNVSANAYGAPIVESPSLLAQTTSVSAISGYSGTHTIRLEFTQTGLTSASAGGLLASLASSFTTNFLLNGADVQSVTLTTYVDNNNTAFGRGTQIASQTYTSGPTNASGQLPANIALTNEFFSETLVITATFTGPSAGLQADAQIVRVPEPASFALLGSALLGLGFARRSRRKG
ncbi:PEP-CTERM sorting domain-containing protein [Roseococcus pinisoli]|uniref:PEP-CTERM sorting domain-containing protein n=1 Tax=Roseococcus pinisoli TaxID=2835040 RepID=A0ABS5QEC0_9PROT|nr:PEP-CTERM sorting domain-containing protein [Roseococcus pinisoli]MBS7812050.1 PEP-CTERM sorting domain-containing protein [Roseococcus pinisoli]